LITSEDFILARMPHKAIAANAGKRLKSPGLALIGTDPGAPMRIGFTCKKRRISGIFET